MARYTDIQHLEKFKRLLPVVHSDLVELQRTFPGVPRDFVDFLSEIGAGTVGPEPGAFKVYGSLVAPDEIYDSDRASGLKGILLFGDDFQGYCTGFEIERGWRVVEISPNDGSVDQFADTFERYLGQHIVPG